MKGKMVKHKLLLKRQALLPHLPETHWLTASRSMRMLKSYSTIFIKPNRGSGGTGIIKIQRTRSGFKLFDGRKRQFLHTDDLKRTLNGYQKSSKKYIVQKGLHLGRYQGKIFDVRMYLQKPNAGWMISGMAARVAAPNRYVTNHHKGGHAESLDKVLFNLFANNKVKVDNCLKTLRKIVLIVAETLDKRFPDLRELGIDLAIDRSGHVWFIEANSRPFHQLFTQLPDKTMLQLILENKRIIESNQIAISAIRSSSSSNYRKEPFHA
jgi:glutathione synthase/RimK-type ligase-like ATP-grasp enzyme